MHPPEAVQSPFEKCSRPDDHLPHAIGPGAFKTSHLPRGELLENSQVVVLGLQIGNVALLVSQLPGAKTVLVGQVCLENGQTGLQTANVALLVTTLCS